MLTILKYRLAAMICDVCTLCVVAARAQGLLQQRRAVYCIQVRVYFLSRKFFVVCSYIIRITRYILMRCSRRSSCTKPAVFVVSVSVYVYTYIYSLMRGLVKSRSCFLCRDANRQHTSPAITNTYIYIHT